jgi:general L-amino acid transport system permease protein
MIDAPSNAAPPFVRTELLAPQAPPISQRGAVRWSRENLFPAPLTTLLTLLGIAFACYLVISVYPWLAHFVWNASSLNECREIISKAWGPDASGACWAVIRERWNQYFFGFYPDHLYWRPVLTFVLLCLAFAPVLFDRVPRQLLWFSLCFPVIAYWLLWGGTGWTAVTILAGPALGLVAMRLARRSAGAVGAVAAAVLVPVLWWVLLAGSVANAFDSVIPLQLEPVPSDKFGGFLLSFVIGVCGIVFSLPLGILLALGRLSDMPLIKTVSVGFIEFIRGMPLLTLLFTASFLLGYFLPPGTDFDLILRVIIIVTLFSAAYIAEAVRGGLAALPRGQYEAADALGFDYWKAQRLIIMPQALKIAIPSIVSIFIGLFKDTTLVIFVNLLDPLKGITDTMRATTAWNGIYWEPYIFSGTIFFIFCFGMSRYSRYLERRLKTDHR